ncbi:MAG: glycoside hydrolase family 3 C-terminal domain-containing protein [Acidobacteriaceae bacterium]
MGTQGNLSFGRKLEGEMWMGEANAQRGGSRWFRGACKTAILMLMVASPSCRKAAAQSSSSTPIYLDTKQPISARVDDLMRCMTLKEKVGQLNIPAVYVDQFGKTGREKMEACKKLVAGTYTSEIGPVTGLDHTLSFTIQHGTLSQRVEFFNELQKIALTETRLKIPLLEDEEGTHGAMFPGATVFPEGLSIGSTFDMPLVNSIYAASAQEARAVGIHVLSTLVLETDRDPRMGRNMEAYTEDPYLYSRIATNIVEGAQGTNIDAPDKVVALMTDFPTQSEPSSGMERGAIEVSERSIRENFLPPWIAAFKAGALGVMAGYPEIDDVPEHSSEKWNTKILRQELGFKGIVVSEGGGFDSLIYEHIVPDQKQAGALALWAGVDMDITYEPAYMGPLIENVEEGKVPEALVDRAVRRVLYVKFRLGLFDHSPYVDVAQAQRVVHSEEHQQLALRAARESIVLLKNDKNMLPLKKDLKSIAVIGPNADDGWSQLGDYSPSAVPQKVITVLDGIKQKVSPGTRVEYVHGCDVIGGKEDFATAVEAARKASVAVVVVGENPRNAGKGGVPATDGEGYDVATLDLTGAQGDLIKAIQATGIPTVVVLINGRPLSVRWAAAHVPAIVEAWEPGERGGEAVADVLFGDYNPSGRLAITIPRSIGQLPAYYNYKPSKEYWIKDGDHGGGYVDMPGTPLYPFGYGLSYTEFKYSNLRVTPAQISQAGDTKVSVDVTNTGTQPGVETVQLYVHERYTPVAIPVKQLHGFERVTLNPGETKTVTMKLTPEDLMLLDRDMHWTVVAGTFDIMIGKSSADIVLSQPLQVQVTNPLLDRGLSIQPDLAR